MMLTRAVTASALMLAVSGDAQADSNQDAANRAIYGELQATNHRLDTLMNAMQLQSRSVVVTSVPAIFAIPFPIACDGDCAKTARGACSTLGYTQSWSPRTPPVPGQAEGSYESIICYGRP